MKILITGFAGFVSRHFLTYLNSVSPGAMVLGIDKNCNTVTAADYPFLQISTLDTDLLNKATVNEALLSFRPDYILHLASVSSVAQSWQTPYESFINNTNIFLNLAEQVRLDQLPCRILSVGSSEEYGEVAEKDLPLKEDHALKPLSPYAVARVSQEMLSKIYADGFEQDIVITRSFNHIGPGQREHFVISSFARQLVKLSMDKSLPRVIVTGNLQVIRDFLDVRDVVKAYYELLLHGKRGEVYNICSGKGTVLKDIVLKMAEMLNLEIGIEINPALIRPNENKIVVGSFEKIRQSVGWSPEIPLDQSLRDILSYWQAQLA